MKHCKSCHTLMPKGNAHQSFPRIERLLRFHGIADPMVKQVARDSGPLCSKCLSDWTKNLSSN
jgi:hypothetical protein